MTIELILPLAGGAIAAVGGGVAMHWNRRRLRAEDDGRAIRTASRELYRELDAATRCLPAIERARTNGELMAAIPKIGGWQELRRTLADHAVKVVWMELAYNMDQVVRAGEDLARENMQAEVRKKDRADVMRDVEQGIRRTLGILEVLLPSETPSRASERLGPFQGPSYELEKLRDQQVVVRRALDEAQPPSPERAAEYGKLYDASLYWPPSR